MTLESGDVFTAHVYGNVLVLQVFGPTIGNEIASVCLPASEVAELLCYEDMDTSMHLSDVDLLYCDTGLRYDTGYRLVFDDHSVRFNDCEWKLFIEAIKSQAWRFLQ